MLSSIVRYVLTVIPLSMAVFAASAIFLPELAAMIVTGGFVVAWSIAGFHIIPSVHRALIETLGRRGKSEHREGPIWIIPLIMKLNIQSMERITVNTKPTMMPTKTQEEIQVDVSMFCRPAEGLLYTYVEVRDPETTAKQWLLQRTLRAVAGLSLDEAIKKDTLREKIYKDLNGTLKEVEDVDGKKRYIIPDMGLEIIDVQVESTKQSPQAAEAADLIRKEEREAAAERMQTEARIAQAKKLVEASGGKMSFAEAWDRASVEGGHMKGIKVIGSGHGGVNPFTEAAAIISQEKDGG